MKKFFITFCIVFLFILYSFLYNIRSAISSVSPQSTAANTNSSVSATANTPTPVATTPSGTTSGSSSSLYKDGTYTGSAANAFYGNIQVQTTIQGGKITNVQFLQAPSDRSRSQSINSYADPLLAQEAIQTQSANVNVVSGATDSSYAFMQSLSTALSQAGA